MSSSGELKESRELAFGHVVRQYYTAMEGGKPLRLEDLLAEHPEFEKELRSFFLDIGHLEVAKQELPGQLGLTRDLTTDETNPRDSEPFHPPRLIRDYEVLGKLGEGGMGTVYLAVHTHLEKRVAIKFIKGQRGSQSAAVERFRREIKAVGQMDHEHIVRALDAGQVDGLYYLVMEYIEGCNLADLLRGGPPLTIADACELCRQAAVAIGHAHSFGIVHRDVKPSNLMLTPMGKVKLLDLGLAQFQQPNHETRRLTVDGQAVGTLKFMAPEQFEDGGKVTASCDIFSLGVTLIDLIYGELAPGNVVAGFDIARLSERRSDVPQELIALIGAMTALRAEDRIQSTDVVIDQLSKWNEGHDLAALVASYQRIRSVSVPTPSLLESPPVATTPHVTSITDKLANRSTRRIGAMAIAGIALFALAAAYMSQNWGAGNKEFNTAERNTAERNTADGGTPPGPTPGLIDPPPIQKLDFPAVFPWIPEQDGAWAEFDAEISLRTPEANYQHSYYVELQCLNEQVIDGQTYRWIRSQIHDLNSRSNETAWILVDTEQYQIEQKLSIHQGFIKADLPIEAEFRTDELSTVTARWSNTIDPLEEFAQRAGFHWPESRINSMTLFSLMFGLTHPSVSPQFLQLRTQLATHTDNLIIEPSDFMSKTGELLSWHIESSTSSSSESAGLRYVIDKAQDYRSEPFSFLQVEIDSQPIQVHFKRSKAGIEAQTRSIDLVSVESETQFWDAVNKRLDATETSDFSRATLPKQEGDWVNYAGGATPGNGPALTMNVDVRAGEQEWIDERPYRWIEVWVRSGIAGQYRSPKGEGVVLLVDETAYEDHQRFEVKEGWHVIEDDVFEFDLDDDLVGEKLFARLRGDGLGVRYRIQEVLTVLFDAHPASGQLPDIRELISGANVATGATRERTSKLSTHEDDLIVWNTWSLNNQNPNDLSYEIHWSPDVPFSFGDVSFSFPRRFATDTELKRFRSDHDALFGTIDELKQRAETTRQALADMGIYLWRHTDGTRIAGSLRDVSEGGISGSEVQLRSAIGPNAGSTTALAFTEIPLEIRQKIYENHEPRTWTSTQGSTVRASFVGFSGANDIRTLERLADANSDRLKIVLLWDRPDWLKFTRATNEEDRAPNEEDRAPKEEDWAPKEVDWDLLSTKDQQFILNQLGAR